MLPASEGGPTPHWLRLSASEGSWWPIAVPETMECRSLNEFAVQLLPPAETAGYAFDGNMLIRCFLNEFLCFALIDLFMMLWNICMIKKRRTWARFIS